VPAEAYEALMDKLEDMELAELVRQREDEDSIKVSIHDL
jgi:antitoxin StbD